VRGSNPDLLRWQLIIVSLVVFFFSYPYPIK
jgi:hypothetical protein